MMRLARGIASLSLLAVACFTTASCALRAADVKALPANPADFALWSCERVYDEADRVQQQAAEKAYAFDARAGQNIMALGVGLSVFWPALLAMRPAGLEAEELARFKGRYEALLQSAVNKACPPAGSSLSAEQAAKLPLAVGERLVYEVRLRPVGPARQEVLQVSGLRRAEFEFRGTPASGMGPADVWLQDRAGNLLQAPAGSLMWPHLLKSGLELGQVTAGDIVVVGDPTQRARMRGQVVAVGPQTVAGRRFDVAVIELFGDAPSADSYTRVDGALVVDRTSGVLLRLDLRSANTAFLLQRRLTRVEVAAPG